MIGTSVESQDLVVVEVSGGVIQAVYVGGGQRVIIIDY